MDGLSFRIVCGSWGEPKTGKSDLVLRTFPEPIWYVDLDFGYEEIAHKFRDREIIWKPIGESMSDLTNSDLLMDPRYHDHYLKEVVRTYVEGLETLRNSGGTVCIDTFTQVRQAIDSVKLEEVRERKRKIVEKKKGDPDTDIVVYPFDHSEANKITGAVVRRAYQTPGVNVVFIHRSTTVYDSNGRATNDIKLHGWKEITSAVGLVLHTHKEMHTVKNAKTARFSVDLDVVRGDPDLTGMTLYDPSYEQLRALLEK